MSRSRDAEFHRMALSMERIAVANDTGYHSTFLEGSITPKSRIFSDLFFAIFQDQETADLIHFSASPRLILEPARIQMLISQIPRLIWKDEKLPTELRKLSVEWDKESTESRNLRWTMFAGIQARSGLPVAFIRFCHDAISKQQLIMLFSYVGVSPKYAFERLRTAAMQGDA